MENMTLELDLSEYHEVFCDSKEALEWARLHGLPSDAVVRTSSPALLLENKPRIVHVESRWTVKEMRGFQTTIKKFSEDVYKAVRSVPNVCHEEAMCTAQAAVLFHRVLFKAACLTEDDLRDPRLFLRVQGDGGAGGNNMNPPWDILLDKNNSFQVVDYELKGDSWKSLSTHGVSFFTRAKTGGIETVVYRLLVKLMTRMPSGWLNNEVVILKENELVMEVAASLALKGVRIRRLTPVKEKRSSKGLNTTSIKEAIRPIVRKRISDWVVDDFVLRCENFLFNKIEEALVNYESFLRRFEPSIDKEGGGKTVLLSNAPSNLAGFAVTKLCREKGIPVISAQHGVSKEICATHGELSVNYETNVSDCFITYNSHSARTSQLAYFARGSSFVAGTPSRYSRIKHITSSKTGNAPIVYVSTNLYKGNLGLFGTWMTDYDRALNEQNIVRDVLSKIPYQISYKTYPEENRRYADRDPLIEEIGKHANIKLFDEKVDVRFFLSQYKVIVTSAATSTLGWAIMAGTPVVFINVENNMPLFEEARELFSKGLFLFEGTEESYRKLLEFLSKPIATIEHEWDQKKDDREILIKEYFSEFKGGAGKRAARMIIDKYLK